MSVRRSVPAALSLEERQAIVDGTIRYCWALDDREWAELAQVFAPDATAEFGFAPAVQGLAKIQDFVAGVLTPLDCSQHMVTNHQIELEEDGARSRCYFHAQHTRKGVAGGRNYVVAGIYRDTWTRSGELWRIRHRVLQVLWTEGNPAVVGAAQADE